MVQVTAKILRNTGVKGNYFHLAVEAPEIARTAVPGQFVMIKAGDDLLPLLRRPFSIHRIGYRLSVYGSRARTANRKPNTVEILYEVVGQGTDILSAKKPGEYLDMIGPLGNGFSYELRPTSNKLILIAGGMGVAPLFFLAEKLSKKSKMRVLIGARSADQILCEKEFKKYGCDVTIATDDGSRGFKGLVTDLLIRQLSTVNCQLSTIYACGPQPMLKAVSGIAREHACAGQLSLEAHMACGIGACLGCVINTTSGYQRVCKEGPVFDALEIIW